MLISSMVSSFISRIVILLFGTLYPAYASYKAVRTKNVKEYVKWMMYWIVFALFTCAETFTDLFFSFWFPFYYEIKIITVIYLLSPATRGSSILYRRFVHPVLIKREQEIDEYIAKAKEQGYHTMLNLGTKGVTYATSLLMQTAIKSGGGLISQLKRSYSLGDINEEANTRSRGSDSDDAVDGRFEIDSRPTRRIPYGSPKRFSGGYQSGVSYMPEPMQYYSHIPSSEDVSSGYSSGDPLYYETHRPRGDQLVRTASFDGSSRIQTRASAKAGLPKRSSLSEGGSTWSTVEAHESQIETDIYYDVPLSQSAPIFPFSLKNLVSREFQQQMFGSLTQEQMIALMNQYCNIPISSNVSWESLERNSHENNPSLVISEVKSNDDTGSVMEKGFLQNVSSHPVENACRTPSFEKDASPSERSGKYNKKPAPVPPSEEFSSNSSQKTIEEDDEENFGTPEGSPKLERKSKTATELTQEQERTSQQSEQKSNKSIETETESKTDELKQKDLLQVPMKKTKQKKGEFRISKKLHLPKVSFSFWHQKGIKPSSESETSSIASIEIPLPKTDDTKNETEVFISLRDDDNTDYKKEDNDMKEDSKQTI